jgi:hypothetical protein
MIPLALLLGLGGVVGFAAIREPAVAPVPVVLAPAPPERALAARIADAPPVTVVAPPRKPSVAPLLAEPEVFKRTARSDDINHRMGMGAAGTYIFEMLEGHNSVVRWPVRPTEPIRVWVAASSQLEDWTSKNAGAARDGFKRWTAAGIPVRINFVMDSASAEIRVRWVEKLDEKVVGITRRRIDSDYWLTGADITLGLHEAGGAALNVDALRAIATHEAGHALGLEHSPNWLDIMSWNFDRQIEPSPADLMTLRLLYTLPPGRFR